MRSLITVFIVVTLLMITKSDVFASNIDNDIVLNKPTKTLTAPQAVSYQWYLNGMSLNQNIRQLRAISAGTYSVQLTTDDGTISTKSISINSSGELIKIITIGDSTVQDYSDGYYPRTGWGQVFQSFFDTANVVVINKAVGGTSSKSFYDSFWTDVKSSLEPGNFVFIQFGINDANTDPARQTVASTTFKEYLTKFVTETQAAGAFPVLVATLRRNAWNSDGTPYDAYHGYPIATRQLAAELNVPLIDLDAKSKALMTELGSAYVGAFWYMNLEAGDFQNYMSGNSDDVHFQEMGAIAMARLVTEEIKDLSSDANLSTLIPYLKPLYQLSVSADSDSIRAITRTASYPADINVTFRAKPVGDYVIDRWSSLDSDSVNRGNIIYVTMPSKGDDYTAHLLYGPDYEDCNGVYKGSAFTDNCGDCVGGNTLASACKNDFTFDTIKIVTYETEKCLEANAKLSLQSSNNDYNQKWLLESAIDDSYYKIKNLQTGNYLDIASSNVALSDTGAMWRIEEADSGVYKLISKEDLNLVVDIFRSYILVGARNTKESQQFRFEKTSIATEINNSLEPTLLDDMVTLSPNPFSNSTTITFASNNLDYNLTLVDARGTTVYSKHGKSADTLVFGENLPSGVYVGKLVIGNSVGIIKLIKY